MNGMLHDFEPAYVEAERARDEQLAETAYLTALHEHTGLPTAIVGHVFFARPDRDQVLAGHAASPLVRGVRSKPVTSAGPGESGSSGSTGPCSRPTCRCPGSARRSARSSARCSPPCSPAPEADGREMFYGIARRVYRPRLRGDGDG